MKHVVVERFESHQSIVSCESFAMPNNSSGFEWVRYKSKKNDFARRLRHALSAIALLLTNLALWTSPSQAEQLLFQDDFDDGVILDEWTIPDTGLELIDGRVRSTQNV